MNFIEWAEETAIWRWHTSMSMFIVGLWIAAAPFARCRHLSEETILSRIAPSQELSWCQYYLFHNNLLNWEVFLYCFIVCICTSPILLTSSNRVRTLSYSRQYIPPKVRIFYIYSMILTNLTWIMYKYVKVQKKYEQLCSWGIDCQMFSACEVNEFFMNTIEAS